MNTITANSANDATLVIGPSLKLPAHLFIRKMILYTIDEVHVYKPDCFRHGRHAARRHPSLSSLAPAQRGNLLTKKLKSQTIRTPTIRSGTERHQDCRLE
jgi:hypothetical protein